VCREDRRVRRKVRKHPHGLSRHPPGCQHGDRNWRFWRNRFWVQAAAGFVGQDRGRGHGWLCPAALHCGVDVPWGWEDAPTHGGHPQSSAGFLCRRDNPLSLCPSVRLSHRCAKLLQAASRRFAQPGGSPASLQAVSMRCSEETTDPETQPWALPRSQPVLAGHLQRGVSTRAGPPQPWTEQRLPSLPGCRMARFRQLFPLHHTAEPVAPGRTMATLPWDLSNRCSRTGACRGESRGSGAASPGAEPRRHLSLLRPVKAGWVCWGSLGHRCWGLPGHPCTGVPGPLTP